MSIRTAENLKSGIKLAVGAAAIAFYNFWETDLDGQITRITEPEHIDAIFRWIMIQTPFATGAGAWLRDRTSPKQEIPPENPQIRVDAKVPAQNLPKIGHDPYEKGPAIVLDSPLPPVVQQAPPPATVAHKPSGFVYGKRSLDNLASVHNDLQRLAFAVLDRSPYDLAITDGLRSFSQQMENVENEASSPRTLKHGSYGRHLTAKAIDFMCYDEDNTPTWEWEYYEVVGKLFVKIGAEMGIPVTWGGAWRSKDGPHVELSREHYPDPIAWRPNDEIQLA